MVLAGGDGRVTERILVIDNYDSFTWNLVHLLQVATEERDRSLQIDVWRNDSHTVEEVLASRPAGIVLSPGPDSPAEAGICVELLRRVGGQIPVFGVCLGHQCLAAALGGAIMPAHRIVHGKVSQVHHDGLGVFAGLPSPITAMRYHSLVVEPESLPPELVVSAWASAIATGRWRPCSFIPRALQQSTTRRWARTSSPGCWPGWFPTGPCTAW